VQILQPPFHQRGDLERRCRNTTRRLTQRVGRRQIARLSAIHRSTARLLGIVSASPCANSRGASRAARASRSVPPSAQPASLELP
jgi:hypothetical protein